MHCAEMLISPTTLLFKVFPPEELNQQHVQVESVQT